MRHILKCVGCGRYTLRAECECGGKAITMRPPKYSPEDAYGKYRRQTLKEELIEKGLL